MKKSDKIEIIRKDLTSKDWNIKDINLLLFICNKHESALNKVYLESKN